MPGALAALRRLGVDPAGRDFGGIAYVSATQRVEHRFDGGAGRGVRRTVLHAAMAERVDALGIPVVHGRVSSVAQDPDRVRAEWDGGGASAGWMIAADGLHSTVRRLVGSERAPVPAAKRRFGIRRHFEVAPWSDLVEVHWTPDVEAYVTPVDEGTVGVALLGPPHVDFDDALARIPQLVEHLDGARASSSTRGAGPLRQRTTHRVTGRVLLAGDASGYVDALTGEGLRVGFAQARSAVRSIADGDPGRYERAWARDTRDFRILTSALVAAARSPFRDRIVPAAVASPALFGRIVDRLAR
jgi:flavin-dependent dehydrogenase